MLWPTVSCKTVPANVKTSLSTSARMTVWTRKLLACPPERTMSKRSASESGTRTSFWFSFSDSSELLKNFTEKFSEALGPGTEEIRAEDHNTIRDQKQRLKEAQKELKEAEKLVEQKEKVSQELHEITQKIERTQTRIAEKESKTNTIEERPNSTVKESKKFSKNMALLSLPSYRRQSSLSWLLWARLQTRSHPRA